MGDSMRCEDCGFELDAKWRYCPDCGEVVPESEAEKQERKAKHEARLQTDPDYKAYIDRQAERNKMMRPLLALHHNILYAQFINDKDPLTKIKGKE